MKYALYSIRDVKAGFMSPFSYDSDNGAKRYFSSMINFDSKTLLYQFPKDFSLFKIGSFDTDTGMVEMDGIPEFICEGIDLKENIE